MEIERSTAAALWDMRQYARATQQLIQGVSHDQYLADQTLRWAVERTLQIVGEAASQVPRQFREEHPEIQWGPIIGMRNVIVHGYTRLDQEIVWDVITRDVPSLALLLDQLIPPEP